MHIVCLDLIVAKPQILLTQLATDINVLKPLGPLLKRPESLKISILYLFNLAWVGIHG
jgi:hypothetical protein